MALDNEFKLLVFTVKLKKRESAKQEVKDDTERERVSVWKAFKMNSFESRSYQ